MAYETRDNSGTLFRNEKKEKDTHPNMNGTCMIDGVEYWISAWTKEGAKGRFQSLAFKRKEPKAATGGGAPNDDIPFAPMYAGKAWSL